jgi:cell division FtsZ-interacting protein ZapD
VPLKVDVQKTFPELSSLDDRDKLKLIIWAKGLSDILETISRRAQEAGEIAERVEKQQQSLVNSLASPSITHSQDALLGSIGNLSADLTAKIAGVVPVGGKIAIKDNNGNAVNILVE